MKVKFCCDNNANIHSKKVQVFDTVKDFGLDDGEWESMSEEQKEEMLMDWVHENLNAWWEEV